MGILSWFRFHRSDRGKHSLVKYRYEDPAFEPIVQAAAADVARMEEDDKYFRPNSPAEGDER